MLGGNALFMVAGTCVGAWVVGSSPQLSGSFAPGLVAISIPAFLLAGLVLLLPRLLPHTQQQLQTQARPRPQPAAAATDDDYEGALSASTTHEHVPALLQEAQQQQQQQKYESMYEVSDEVPAWVAPAGSHRD